jgi:hypothetical protein
MHAKERLREILDVSLQDHRQSWSMRSDGSYERLQPDRGTTIAGHLGTHQTLIDLTRQRARRMS